MTFSSHGGYSRHARGPDVWLQELPYHLLRHPITEHPVSAADLPEHVAIRQLGRGGPCIDRDLYPGGHRDGAHPPMLANQIDDTPAAIHLLDVLHRERRHLGPAQSAAEEYRQHRAVAEPLLGGNVWRVQELLGLLNGEPVSDASPSTWHPSPA